MNFIASQFSQFLALFLRFHYEIQSFLVSQIQIQLFLPYFCFWNLPFLNNFCIYQVDALEILWVQDCLILMYYLCLDYRHFLYQFLDISYIVFRCYHQHLHHYKAILDLEIFVCNQYFVMCFYLHLIIITFILELIIFVREYSILTP